MVEVVITGLGVILPNCRDRKTFWRQLREGDSQLRFEPDPSDPACVRPIGRIDAFDPEDYLAGLSARHYARYGRAQLLYVASLVSALRDAGLEIEELQREKVGLFDGTARDNLDFWLSRLDAEPPLPFTKRDLGAGLPGMGVGLAAALLGIRGPTYTYAGACSAGAIAIGGALHELQLGEIEVALATGHDAALLAPLYQMYNDARLLSAERDDPRRAIRPYAGHGRNAFGEGAVTLVLESRRHAERRGAEILATLAGYRFGNAGIHPTHVDPTGQRSAELIEDVLRRASLDPAEVGFVIGHGNGVEASDQSELGYMRRIFGERAASVPLLSTKPIYGHTLGASAALSVAAAALMIHHEFVAPAVDVDEARSRSGGPQRSEAALVVSYGMGGQNAVLLLRRDVESAPSRRAA
jgi:3-oxoacyl-[acyl-carrier-protein] synthase II